MTEPPLLEGDELIKWLRSRAGTLWSRENHRSSLMHQKGVFAETKRDIERCVHVRRGSSCVCNEPALVYDSVSGQIARDYAASIGFEKEEEASAAFDIGYHWMKAATYASGLLSAAGPGGRPHP